MRRRTFGDAPSDQGRRNRILDHSSSCFFGRFRAGFHVDFRGGAFAPIGRASIRTRPAHGRKTACMPCTSGRMQRKPAEIAASIASIREKPKKTPKNSEKGLGEGAPLA
jgi:hypothetical protein